MYEIDNEKFGVFLAQLRKQKGFTQKELAQKLFVSDKAVSKWERGLSMPDIALLSPLANLFSVTIAFPLLYLAVSWFFPVIWSSGKLYFTLFACLGFFIPIMVAGKRYE
ncbi:helix-turn-helix domain-containing protein [Caproiciproducens galactitolivorans]|uniref:helix-turn-helix domain-containing protein n=1 Tax=Caproiciproducens galactitolivorans TaxID=642589 RepID=UPI0038B37BA9